MNNQERLYLVKAAARAKAVGNFFSGVGNKIKGLLDFDGRKLKRDQAEVNKIQELQDIQVDELMQRNKSLKSDGKPMELLPGKGLSDRFQPGYYAGVEGLIPKKPAIDIAKEQIPKLHKNVKPPVSRHR